MSELTRPLPGGHPRPQPPAAEFPRDRRGQPHAGGLQPAVRRSADACTSSSTATASATSSFQGTGCAISKASASLMTEALKGKTVDEARALFERFHDMVTSSPETDAARSRQAVGAVRRARVSDSHQVREPGVAHVEGGGVGATPDPVSTGMRIVTQPR